MILTARKQLRTSVFTSAHSPLQGGISSWRDRTSAGGGGSMKRADEHATRRVCAALVTRLVTTFLPEPPSPPSGGTPTLHCQPFVAAEGLDPFYPHSPPHPSRASDDFSNLFGLPLIIWPLSYRCRPRSVRTRPISDMRCSASDEVAKLFNPKFRDTMHSCAFPHYPPRQGYPG